MIRVLALDVDGVLTDGGVWLDEDGRETLRFHVRDGVGIAKWLGAGGTCVWITGRSSAVVPLRAQRLGVTHVLAGVSDKVTALEAFLTQQGYSWDEVAYVGDDEVDLGPMARARLAIAVADAVEAVKARAHVVTRAPGGGGAVREVVEMLMPGLVGEEPCPGKDRVGSA